MGTQVPKQFLLLRGKPVLWHTLQVFLKADEAFEIILVLPQEHMETGRTLVKATTAPHRIRIATGGATRFQSVRQGLGLIPAAVPEEEPSLIFVHDGVRCLVTPTLIHHCAQEALLHGSAIPVVESRDSLRVLTETGHQAIDRSRARCVQTPQTFLSAMLLSAFCNEEIAYTHDEEKFTDEATVVEAHGGRVHLVQGEASNIKITTPLDLILAEELLKRQC